MSEKRINYLSEILFRSRVDVLLTDVLSGKLFLVVYFSQSKSIVDSMGNGEWKSLSMCIKYWLYETRSSTCFNDTACRVYNISYDGGSKYLRTMFVGSRVRACVRACVVYDEIIRRWRRGGEEEGKNIKFCRNGEITAPAIKYHGLRPLEKFARGCSHGGVNSFGIRANRNNSRFDAGE